LSGMKYPPMRRTFITLLAAAAILAASFSAAAASRYYQSEEPLFSETALLGSPTVSQDVAAVRQRFVTVNFGVLDGARSGKSLELNLFSDVTFQAVIDERSSLGGRSVWTGHIEGVEFSQVTLVASDGQIAANVALPEAIYQATYAGNGVHAITQIDQGSFPNEIEPIEIQAGGSEEASPALPAAPSDDGSIIDVLVAYTPAARVGAGGSTAIQNVITLAVAEANQSYANSGVAQRLNLAHMIEVAYTESGDMGTDLVRLQSASDAYMNEVHSLRNTYYADLVSLIEESGQYCGISYLMGGVSSTFKDYAFSVVARSCATGYYSFAHELGHNMGARHDWYVDNTAYSPYSYNHGYVNRSAGWRTIMAYNTECSDQGVNCTRLQYWSNPSVTYLGSPMGVPAGTSISCTLDDPNHPPCDADNRQTLNNTAYTVANFRVRPAGQPTATPTPTPTPTTPATAASFPFYDGFESGQLGTGWFTQVNNQGRVQVSNAAAYAGNYSAVLDDTTGDTTYSIAALALKINLAGQSNVNLEFWWREWDDEDNPEDGVFISADNGGTWKQAMSFNGGANSFQQAQIDLDAVAAAQGLALNDHFLIKFQFYDNYPVPSDGYAIDEVRLYAPTPSTATPTPTPTPVPAGVAAFPFFDGFESGKLGSGWAVQYSEQGRVQVSNAAAYAGNYSAVLDDTTGDTSYSIAALVLTCNLAGQSNVNLEFWWREWEDEDNPEDGVFISADNGGSWRQILSFNGDAPSYQRVQIDLDAVAAAEGLALNDHFMIKFQFYDNYPIPSDGYAIDDVRLYAPAPPPGTSGYFWTFLPVVIK